MEAFMEDQVAFLRNNEVIVTELNTLIPRKSTPLDIPKPPECYRESPEDLERRLSGLSTEKFIQEGLEFLIKDDKLTEERKRDLIGFQLPTLTIASIGSEEDKDICSICHDEFDKGDCTALLGCRHLFHKDCITTWLAITNSCPLCKAPGVAFAGH